MTFLSFDIPIHVEKYLKAFGAANFAFLPNVPGLLIKAYEFKIEG